jgi:asparagine synthase (glutamine-hydrolysing)
MGPEEVAAKELIRILSRSLEGVKGALLISGMDSTLLAHLLPSSNLYTFGLEGSWDMKIARTRSVGARMVRPILLEEGKMLKGLKELDSFDLSLVEISFILPFAIVGGDMREDILITGHGADELFAGYSKYQARPTKKVEMMMREDLAILEGKHLPIIRELLGKRGKSLLAPYLGEEVIELANGIPTELKRKKNILKAALRILSPEPPAEKRALQYSSGVMRWLKREKIG